MQVTKEAYTIAKRVLEEYLAAVRMNPRSVASWYKQDAVLDVQEPEKDQTRRLVGRHSIHQFFKTCPEMWFEDVNYDCHSITTQTVRLAILTVYGTARRPQEGPSGNRYSFTTTMHLQYTDTAMAISYQSWFMYPSQ